MRELKRSIAKANMRDAGFIHLFRKYRGKDEKKRQSVFARKWREYVTYTPKKKPRNREIKRVG